MLRRKLTKDNVEEVATEAATFIKEGKSVIFPTDTLYGLGVNAFNRRAVENFFSLKKRPSSNPVPVFVKDIEMAKELAFINERRENILYKLWPGAFTVVLEKKNRIDPLLTSGTNTVGLRIPASDFCKLFLEKAGVPVTASSANISGEKTPFDINEILGQFDKFSMAPDMVVDMGILEKAEPSTVIDITGREPVIIRMNESTKEKLKEVFGDL